MNKGAKDSDVERFMMMFKKLRDWTDDDPAHVEVLSREDDGCKRLCFDLDAIVGKLEDAETSVRRLYTAPVGTDFIAAWRDFESRYRIPLSRAVLAGLGLTSGELENLDLADASWIGEQAHERAEAIHQVMEFVAGNIDEAWHDLPDTFRSEIKNGVDEWRHLTRETGFDLEGLFKRRKLIPFVLVPRHISDRQGNKEKLSLFTHLQQAHEAFVYGAPFAAIALMRSILEVVLRDYYRASGEGLRAYIDSVRLPKAVERNALHKLRKLGNQVLHDWKVGDEVVPNLDREIIEHLILLRNLIEKAPSNRWRQNEG